MAWKFNYSSMRNTWCGAIIEEGLNDKEFLEHLKELRIIYTGKDKTQNNPNERHIHILLFPNFMVKNVMSELTSNFYAYFKNVVSDDIIVIWKDKMFNCTTDKETWNDFQEYGKSINIKERQLVIDIDMVTLSEDEINLLNEHIEETKAQMDEYKVLKQNELINKYFQSNSEMWIRYFYNENSIYTPLEKLQNDTDSLGYEFMWKGNENMRPEDFKKIENVNGNLIEVVLNYILRMLYEKNVIKPSFCTMEGYENLKQFLYNKYCGFLWMPIQQKFTPNNIISNDVIPSEAGRHIKDNSHGFKKTCGDCLLKPFSISLIYEKSYETRDNRYWVTFNLIIRKYYDVSRPDLLDGLASRFYDKKRQRSSFIESFHTWRIYKEDTSIDT